MSDAAHRFYPVPFPRKGYLYAPSTIAADKAFSPHVLGTRFLRGQAASQPRHTPFATGPLGAGVAVLDNIPLDAMLFEHSGRNAYTLAMTQRKVYRYNGTTVPTSEWLDITGGAVFTGGDDDTWNSAVADDNAVFTNGINGVWSWNGAGNIAQLTNTYSGRVIEGFAGRCIIGNVFDGVTTLADRVQWSGYQAVNQWNAGVDPTAGSNDLTDIPGPVLGLKVGGPQCFIYKRNAIIRMIETGLVTPAFAFQIASPGVGTIAGRSIVAVGGVHFFLGEDNVYAYDGSTPPTPIGFPVRDEIFATLNWSQIRKIFAFHHQARNEYWLFLPTGSSTWPGVAFVYNYIDQVWWKTELIRTCGTDARAVTASGSWDSDPLTWDSDTTSWDTSASGAESLFPILGKTDKQFSQFNEIDFTEDALYGQSSLFHTADDQLGLPGVLKTIDRIILVGRSASTARVEVGLSVDGGQTFPSTSFGYWPSSASTVSPVRIILNMPRITGDYFRMSFSSYGSFDISEILFEGVSRDSEVR